ncbi:unnamed protein product [Ostreobium quekettii]|uniref:Tetrapyrrole biosynthesis uroporphyrinogen III synthase domain-containing protein n=1 Tax=Ostreobium quekettii TaxID=121088 RepID=A0A8S1IU56_9CHLO|nr:unnamed protein product [Ostreobium quekettii]
MVYRTHRHNPIKLGLIDTGPVTHCVNEKLDVCLATWYKQWDASCEPADLNKLDGYLAELETFSHIAFTSKNGIRAVLQRLSVMHGGIEQAVHVIRTSGTRLCALGVDGDELRAAGMEVHVEPEEASTLGLVRELVDRSEAKGSRILCPVPCVQGGLKEPQVVPRFLKALEDAGASPVRVDAYVTQAGCDPSDCSHEGELLRKGAIDAIAFSSTAEVGKRNGLSSSRTQSCFTLIPLLHLASTSHLNLQNHSTSAKQKCKVAMI